MIIIDNILIFGGNGRGSQFKKGIIKSTLNNFAFIPF
jgi:hypothetical protein